MTRGQSIWSIELPQAIVAMLPSLVSQFVVILKDTALGSIITYTELLRSAQILGGRGGLLQILVAVAVIFILINWMLSRFAEWTARRVSGRTSGRTRPHEVGATITVGHGAVADAPDDPRLPPPPRTPGTPDRAGPTGTTASHRTAGRAR